MELTTQAFDAIGCTNEIARTHVAAIDIRRDGAILTAGGRPDAAEVGCAA